jgi:hypothetical protein
VPASLYAFLQRFFKSVFRSLFFSVIHTTDSNKLLFTVVCLEKIYTPTLFFENIALRTFISSPQPRLCAAMVPAVRSNV